MVKTKIICTLGPASSSKKVHNKMMLAGKIVIAVTQMLENMTENRIPTRAEESDVANAIIDGTDFVMLSAESAVGNYPVETVDMMKKIINFTEKHLTVKDLKSNE